MQKGEFSLPMKFLFHTLLICVSNKTTAFNEIPLNIQYLGYAIRFMSKTDFNYSQEIFNGLVKNVKNIREKKPQAFLLFPRFLSYYLQQKIPKENAQVLVQGAPLQINSLYAETFTRLMAKESKDSKTQA
ncbi:hypothetical protein Hanom_Chr02g00114871 [Helianthus anomalus]